jgi:hypothetical protein
MDDLRLVRAEGDCERSADHHHAATVERWLSTAAIFCPLSILRNLGGLRRRQPGCSFREERLPMVCSSATCATTKVA